MNRLANSELHENEMLSEITSDFKEITEDPTQFLLVAPLKKLENIKSLLQKTYKACIENDENNKKSPEILPELVVEDMDEEQIWQQLELRNNTILNVLLENTSKLLSLREEKLEVRLDEEDIQNGEEESDVRDNDSEENDMEHEAVDEEEDDDDDDDDDEDPEGDIFEEQKQFKKKVKNVRSSVVDDKFFKLSEMEAFLEEEDAKEMRRNNRKADDSAEATFDYFADDLGVEDDDMEEGEENPTYKEFFDDENEEEEEEQEKNVKEAAKKQKDHFKDESSDEELDMDQYNEDDSEGQDERADEDHDEQQTNENNDGITTKEALQPASSGSDDSEDEQDEQDEKEDEPKSSFEIRQARLQQRIREYEEEVLGEKPWQLRGEVHANSRPANSLLEELLEFESTVRPAPVITEQTTLCLEDIIKQRIKDQAWDDPVIVLKPEPSPHEFRKQLILEQEKSKESLAQVYEKEYQKELDKLDPNRADASEEEPKEHKEIKQLMRALFVKLDALSNFHFTPKPVAAEARIITNTPAVNMEEVAPVAVSDAKLLAPEEVYRGPKHELVGKTERNRTDKNRERRKKKQKQRVIHRLLDEKSKKKQESGIAPTKKEESAKLLKSLTKQRNVEKLNTASDDQRALKSSKSFFSKLQDTTSVAGQAVTAAKAKKQKSTGKTITAKRVKL